MIGKYCLLLGPYMALFSGANLLLVLGRVTFMKFGNAKTASFREAANRRLPSWNVMEFTCGYVLKKCLANILVQEHRPSTGPCSGGGDTRLEVREDCLKWIGSIGSIGSRWWQLKYSLVSSLPGGMIQFDKYFSIGLKLPTRDLSIEIVSGNIGILSTSMIGTTL